MLIRLYWLLLTHNKWVGGGAGVGVSGHWALTLVTSVQWHWQRPVVLKYWLTSETRVCVKTSWCYQEYVLTSAAGPWPWPCVSVSGGRVQGLVCWLVCHTHTVALSHYRTIALSHCPTVTLSHCRTVALSHCHTGGWRQLAFTMTSDSLQNSDTVLDTFKI